jgi:hypothetical protein|tara:strand:- start:121 stop:306 length:186 start_codon:yes stop_codon:yes gene_type:complete
MNETKIKSTPNYSKLTFTIRKGASKYRTNQMTKEEFNENVWNTSSDWENFLKTSLYYHQVK